MNILEHFGTFNPFLVYFSELWYISHIFIHFGAFWYISDKLWHILHISIHFFSLTIYFGILSSYIFWAFLYLSCVLFLFIFLFFYTLWSVMIFSHILVYFDTYILLLFKVKLSHVFLDISCIMIHFGAFCYIYSVLVHLLCI